MSTEKVLILGASGGVGTCCVQLGKMLGAEVIACASSKGKAEKLTALGADHVIDTSTQDFVAETIRLYGKPKHWGGGGVDVVPDHVSDDQQHGAVRLLKGVVPVSADLLIARGGLVAHRELEVAGRAGDAPCMDAGARLVAPGKLHQDVDLGIVQQVRRLRGDQLWRDLD